MLLQPALILGYLMAIFICGDDGYRFPYRLGQPDAIIELPAILNEVSGITDIDSGHIACVQDELGIIFIVNLNTGKIEEQYKFEPTGDFEGLTYVNGSFYVLRSDGQITIIPDYRKPNEKINVKKKLPTSNNEGLGYDQKKNLLLIAAKNKPSTESAYHKEDRLFYQYNIDKAVVETTPAFILRMSDLLNCAKSMNIAIPTSTADFRPSSIAVHPVTQLIYILSAKDYLLIVCDRNGKLMYMEELNPRLYPQAEGITFLPDNTLLITNEADDKVPTMLKFSYSKMR